MNPQVITPQGSENQPEQPSIAVSPTGEVPSMQSQNSQTLPVNGEVLQPAPSATSPQNIYQQSSSSDLQHQDTVTKEVGGMFGRRTGRAGFLGGSLYLLLLLFIATMILFAIINPSPNSKAAAPAIALFVVWFIVYTPFALSLFMRRLHDINTSGGFAVISLLPLFNIFMGLGLLFVKGEPNVNQYGPAVKSKNPFILLGLKRPKMSYQAEKIALAADQNFAAASYKDGVKFQQKHQNRNDAPTGRLAIAGNYLKFTSDNGQELLNLDVGNIKRLAEAQGALVVWDQNTDYGFYFPGWGQSITSQSFGLIGSLNALRIQKNQHIQEFIRALKTINPNISSWNFSWKNTWAIGFIITFAILAIVLAIHYLL